MTAFDRPGEAGPGVARWIGRMAPVRAARRRAGRLDLRATWQVAVGALLLPLGVAAILAAWYGAAHTPYVQQQIPYLVSGSFIGLGLMVVGGLLYWAHWLYRVYDQAELHHRELIERQDFLVATLARLGGSNTAGVPAPVGARPEDGFFATATGTNFHRAGCPIVERHADGVHPITREQRQGLKPCRICDPEAGPR